MIEMECVCAWRGEGMAWHIIVRAVYLSLELMQIQAQSNRLGTSYVLTSDILARHHRATYLNDANK